MADNNSNKNKSSAFLKMANDDYRNFTIIIVVIFIIIVILLIVFVFLPIQDVKNTANRLVEKLEPEIPKIESTARQIEQLIPKIETAIKKIDQTTEKTDLLLRLVVTELPKIETVINKINCTITVFDEEGLEGDFRKCAMIT